MSRYWSLLQNKKISQFSILIDTTKTSLGSSSVDQFKLPLIDGGVFDFKVEWGDGSSNNITSYSDTNKTHTYSSSGEYNIKISGVLEGFSFAEAGVFTGDRMKILNIMSWGSVIFLPDIAIFKYIFLGCENLTNITASDTINSLNTDLRGMFHSTTNLSTINSINNWDLSNVVNTYDMFNSSMFNSSINNWDVSNVKVIGAMFANNNSFNQDISNWVFNANVTVLINMFFNATSFNQDLSSWGISNITDMSNIFNGATSFNQDISNWDFNENVNLTGFMTSKSSANYNYQYYDNLLIKLESIMVGSGRVVTKQLDMGTIKYSSAGLSARNALVADGWTITDGGSI